MAWKGILVEWNDDRGFGFIQPAEGGERVFCHISEFRERGRRPARGQVLVYELTRDERGRPRAQQVRYPNAAPRPVSPPVASPRLGASIVGSGVFVAIIVGAAALGRLSWFVPAWIAGCSAFLFLLYVWDKTAAEGRRWRTQEKTLNLLALLGGWPGGWIAQQAARHKTRKASFQAEFWLAVIVNVVVLGWLVYTGGDPVALLHPSG
ncbi:MAG: cold shock and DUF1294 domain-containing protein [Steroidobacteraceae bacterium]|jgi:uncharacterized membrane protein YsdA (DUF1294 family)/cold shock CspA family protein|nr:cold shock and DUF1294 domain-containing protein [Steroidobacteraceae bacterium]